MHLSCNYVFVSIQSLFLFHYLVMFHQEDLTNILLINLQAEVQWVISLILHVSSVIA